jgi:hypothetical protein
MYGQPLKMIFSGNEPGILYVFNLETGKTVEFPAPDLIAASGIRCIPYNNSDALFLMPLDYDLLLLNLADSSFVTLKSFEWPISHLSNTPEGRYSFLLDEWVLHNRWSLLCFMDLP